VRQWIDPKHLDLRSDDEHKRRERRDKQTNPIAGLSMPKKCGEVAAHCRLSKNNFVRMLCHFLRTDSIDQDHRCFEIGNSFFPLDMPDVDLYRCVAAADGYYEEAQRFDPVQVAMDGGEKFYARLRMLFKYTDKFALGSDKDRHLAVVQFFAKTPVGVVYPYSLDKTLVARVLEPKERDVQSYQIISIDTIDHLVVLKRDFSEHNCIAHFVMTVKDQSHLPLDGYKN
jgi:hypothetical protein